VSGEGIKVHDKRMFTADGELREEYRFLEEEGNREPAAPAAPAASTAPSPPAGPASSAASDPRRAPVYDATYDAEPAPYEQRGRSDSVRLDLPGTPPGLGPSFYDLAAILAEPVALYLGDMELPDGESAENLEMARLHIDLLDVLRQKTVGNLTAQEAAFLEDLLYQLRVRYVQKRG
jgi:Domain of unknown function (DUF1844)